MSTYNLSGNYRRNYSRNYDQGGGRGYARIEYSTNYNPSKGTRFKGVWDADGNYADLD